MVSTRLSVLALAALSLVSCAHLSDLVVPPATEASHPVDFDQLLTLAEHAQLAYEDEAVIDERLGPDVVHGELLLSDIRYYVVDEGSRQLVSIRGTDSVANVAVDAVADTEVAEVLGVEMHEGFLRVGQQLSVTLAARLDHSRPVVLTGHSLGGALALVSGLYLDVIGLEVAVVTFGQPKVTTREGALELTRGGRGMSVDRVVFRGDPVADMPPYVTGDDVLRYAHLGPEIILWSDSAYSYLEPGQILLDEDLMMLSELPTQLDMAPHAIDGYVARLTRLRAGAREVAYHSRHDS